MIKLLIADDHAVVRSGLAMILESQGGFTVVGQAKDGEEAYAMAVRLRPDIVLTDISMGPGGNGLHLLARITEDLPGVKVIILTMYDEREYLMRALRGGASGYVLKNASDEELVLAVRTVHAGEMFVCSQMLAPLVGEALGGSGGDARPQLTEHEHAIVSLIAYGFGNKEIAEKLSISVKTVESHKARVMEKLGVHGRPELVEYALRNKLLL